MLAGQKRLNRSLDYLLQATQANKVRLTKSHRLVIFSDHHRGTRTRADDFANNEETYLTALDHYHQSEFALVLLGDVEELWEEKADAVFKSYVDVSKSEARFYPGRYMRLFGNHDINWSWPRAIQKYLHPLLPDLDVPEAFLFEFDTDEEENGQILLIHGHQGTFFSDVLLLLSASLVRIFWRTYQILTGGGQTTPAEDACIRGAHDQRMYNWVSEQQKTILIAGHTHRPVWSSRTHLEKLLSQMQHLQEMPLEERPPDYKDRLEKLKAEIARRTKEYPPCGDTVKPKPCYFNTGCCSFSDGDITGIEIEGEVIRLIKWGKSKEDKIIKRTILEEARLADIFFML